MTQKELTVLKEQNSQLETIKEKFEVEYNFQDVVLEKYHSAFGNYFLGLKDFIEYARGKQIKLFLEINGSLKLKIQAKSSEDLEFTIQGLRDFILNLPKSANYDDKPEMFSDDSKALIFWRMKASALQNELMLKNDKFLYPNEMFEYLWAMTNHFRQNYLELMNETKELQIKNNLALDKIIELQTQLQKEKILNIKHSDKIDVLLGFVAQIKLAQQGNDPSLLKKAVSDLAQFYTDNKEVLIPIVIEVIKEILNLLKK